MRRYKENIDHDDLQPITVLTLKLSTAAVLARAISQTQKSIERVRSGASRTKSRLQREHHSHTNGEQFFLHFLPHTARFSHHFLTCSYITVTVPAAPKPSLRLLLLASVCMSCPALQAGQVDVDGRGRRRGEQTPPSLPHSPACLLGTRRRRRRAAEPVEGDRVS